MPIGIGQSTPYKMDSNHQTALNHCFRDEAKVDIHQNTKVKCTSCGVWAKKGGCCYLCKRPVATMPLQRRQTSFGVKRPSTSGNESSKKSMEPRSG